MAKINVNNIDWDNEEVEEQMEDEFQGGRVKTKNTKKQSHNFDDGFYEKKSKKLNKPHRIDKDKMFED